VTQLDDFRLFIHKSRYAKYVPEEKRRENWDETVKRFCDYWEEKFPGVFPYKKVFDGIYSMSTMPSMRAFMTAGKALDRDNIAGYNCSYLPIDDVRAFDEVMYILMCGTGVGFSVERQFISKLPVIAEEFHDTETTVRVADSRIGWATALREIISLLYAGKIPKWDVSGVRPAGARLKTFGGRASGPEPLEELFKFAIQLFRRAAGRKLNSLECHDLVCKIADIVVVGGVRRSALISLSNLTDERLRGAKSGQWWETNPQRTLSNNSVAYTETPDVGIFMKEWHSLYESKSGERGIFNRVAAKKKAAENGRRDPNHEFGTNPCGEIILRPCGLCNLTEVVVRENDTEEDLIKKVQVATIIGTFQSTLTKFRYIRKQWSINAEEERLLGVSLTGIMDSVLTNTHAKDLGPLLDKLRATAIETNKEWAQILGIPVSAAITTVKPSGTVSQLVDSSSGIHPRYSRYYIRSVRNDKKDPLSDFLIASGVPYEEDKYNSSTWVFSFPMKSPDASILSPDLGAIAQLEHYKTMREFYCEHNPSITVYVRDNEWFDVAAWVYRNFDCIGGVSFLPYSDHVYVQAPYIPITEEKYAELKAKMPKVFWERFLEDEDNVERTKELACVSGYCEV
jgi:ribonucleoside-triphosphate reductase